MSLETKMQIDANCNFNYHYYFFKIECPKMKLCLVALGGQATCGKGINNRLRHTHVGFGGVMTRSPQKMSSKNTGENSN